jgi:hypothetical protein
LKNHLSIPASQRKNQIDSLLKKCKSKCFKSIHEVLKKCFKLKIQRLPQNFITNIKIEFNKNYMNKTILQIYQQHGQLNNIDEIIFKNLIRQEKKDLIIEFLNMTFRDAYKFYLNSQQYLRDYDNIQEKECQNFAILFNYISKIFLEYYTLSKGNRVKSHLVRFRKIKNQKDDASSKIFSVFRENNNSTSSS